MACNAQTAQMHTCDRDNTQVKTYDLNIKMLCTSALVNKHALTDTHI